MAFESDSNNSNTSEDVYNLYDVDSEPEELYGPGGFMKIPSKSLIADKFKVIQKLGWGHGGIIYLCKDKTTHEYRAVKIYKSHAYYRQEFKNEMKIYIKIQTFPEGNYTPIVFEHYKIKVDDESHGFAVMELLGVSLYEIMKLRDFSGLPLPLCKFITREILKIVQYFHEVCGVIIGDIRGKNILLQLTAAQVRDLEERGSIREKIDFAVLRDTETPIKALNSAFGCGFVQEIPTKSKGKKAGKKKSGNLQDRLKQLSKLGLLKEKFLMKFINLGSACEINENCIRNVPTLNYRSPEILFKVPYTSAVDIWSIGCLVFELVTGQNLFEPLKGKNYSNEEDHLGQMIEYLGDFPSELLEKYPTSAKFFSEGKLKHLRMLRDWPLKHLLIERHSLIPEEAEELATFLKCLLEYDPEKRISVKAALQQPWLSQKSKEVTLLSQEKIKTLKFQVAEREKRYWEVSLKGEKFEFYPVS